MLNNTAILQTFQYLLDLNTGRFIMFSVITNIYNKKIKGFTLMEFFTATVFFYMFFDN